MNLVSRYIMSRETTLPETLSRSFRAYFWSATKTNPMFFSTKLSKVNETATNNTFRKVVLSMWVVLNSQLKFINDIGISVTINIMIATMDNSENVVPIYFLLRL